MSRPTASTMAGSARMLDGAPSSCRPPWFDTTNASAPLRTASRASSAIHDAFQHQLAAPPVFDPRHVVPTQRRIELLRGPAGQRTHVLDTGDVTDDVAELAPPRVQHAPPPARLSDDVGDVCERRLGRCRQTVLQILVALAEDLQVQRQHQCRAACGFGAVDQPADVVAIAHHVQLKPERPRRVRRDVFDRADAHRRQDVRHAELLGGTRRENLTVGVLHAGEPDRRQRDRHRHVLADHLRRERAPVHVHRHALTQLDRREIRRVVVVRRLGPRTRIGVVVEHARHASPRENAQILDAGDDRHVRARRRAKRLAPRPAARSERAAANSSRSRDRRDDRTRSTPDRRRALRRYRA